MLTASGIAASRKRISPFRLFRPSSVEAACDLLGQWPGAVLHAGGIDLVNRMKAGLAADTVVALDRIAELKGVRRVGDTIEIGAAATHWQIEHDPLLKACLPSVPEFVVGLGNVRIRMQGTIGGNVMAGEPGYEMLALLAALDAELHFIDWSDGTRSVVPARAWRGISQAEGRLLSVIAVRLRQVTVAWDRELRPSLGLVASLEWQDERAVSGLGALTGQGPVWEPMVFAQPLSRADVTAQARPIAERWAARLPDIGSPDRDYCNRVAGVMMRRALQQMASA
jgi:carbon-monoxide dehydrogenase medium subunit